MGKTARTVRMVYGLVLGLFTIVVGVLFIVECSQIYYSGTAGSYFSPSVISAHFKKILIPVILWLVAAIAGYVLSVIFPCVQEKAKYSDLRKTEKSLLARLPQGQTEEFLSGYKRYRRYVFTRIILWSAAAAFALASAIISIVYLADASHFPAVSLNGEVIAMLRAVLPYIGVSFLLFTGVTLYEHFTAKRDLELLKKLFLLGKGSPAAPVSRGGKLNAFAVAVTSPAAVWAVRGVILTAAVVFIILGIFNGGVQDVIQKAIKICTECIGLG